MASIFADFANYMAHDRADASKLLGRFRTSWPKLQTAWSEIVPSHAVVYDGSSYLHLPATYVSWGKSVSKWFVPEPELPAHERPTPQMVTRQYARYKRTAD